MSLLMKHNGQTLKQLAEQKHREGVTEEEMQNLFGKRPYYWDLMIAPPYGKFKPGWRDQLGREYSALPDNFMAVRLPIAKNREHTLQMPYPGEKLFLIEVGGGNTTELEVIAAGARRSTGWFEYRKL